MDPLKQVLLTHLAQNPGSLPKEVVDQLTESVDTTRQQLQKQLNVLKRIESKISKKQETAEAKHVSWTTWADSMKRMVLQEAERYEKDMDKLRTDIESLQQELRLEQEKLDSMNKGNGISVPEIPMDETEDEDGIAQIMGILNAKTPKQEGASEKTEAQKAFIEGQKQAMQQIQAMIRQQHFVNGGPGGSTEKVDPPKTDHMKSGSADYGWACKNPDAFAAHLQSLMQSGQIVTQAEGSNSTGRTPAGKRSAMDPFGGAPMQKSPKTAHPAEVTISSPVEETEEATEEAPDTGQPSNPDLQTLS